MPQHRINGTTVWSSYAQNGTYTRSVLQNHTYTYSAECIFVATGQSSSQAHYSFLTYHSGEETITGCTRNKSTTRHNRIVQTLDRRPEWKGWRLSSKELLLPERSTSARTSVTVNGRIVAKPKWQRGRKVREIKNYTARDVPCTY